MRSGFKGVFQRKALKSKNERVREEQTAASRRDAELQKKAACETVFDEFVEPHSSYLEYDVEAQDVTQKLKEHFVSIFVGYPRSSAPEVEIRPPVPKPEPDEASIRENKIIREQRAREERIKTVLKVVGAGALIAMIFGRAACIVMGQELQPEDIRQDRSHTEKTDYVPLALD